MRWLSLVAVLGGCTLITDPDSFEGDPSDAGPDVGDAETDGTVDPDAEESDAGPCMEGTVDPVALTICFEGVRIECDVDGDGFVRDDERCGPVNAERDGAPFDCNDDSAAERHGLVDACPDEPRLDSCIPATPIGMEPGEVILRLDTLVGAGDISPILTFTGRGDGVFEVFYLSACSVVDCNETHRLEVTYAPPWQLSVSDQVITPNAAPPGARPRAVDAYRDAEGVTLAFLGGEPEGYAAIHPDTFMRPPPVSARTRMLPNVAASRFVRDTAMTTPMFLWLERTLSDEVRLHLGAEGVEDPNFLSSRGLDPDVAHPLQAAGSHVVLVGDDDEHQYWAAPPLADAIDTGVCRADRGCQPVRVGGSDPDMEDIRPNGLPRVVEIVGGSGDDTLEGLGVFPVISGVDSFIAVQHLVPGCGEIDVCTDPVLLDLGALGSELIVLDAVAVQSRVFIAFTVDARIQLAWFDATPLVDGSGRLDDIEQAEIFRGVELNRIDRIEITASRMGPIVEVGVLALGADGAGDALWLDIMRACGGVP